MHAGTMKGDPTPSPPRRRIKRSIYAVVVSAGRDETVGYVLKGQFTQSIKKYSFLLNSGAVVPNALHQISQLNVSFHPDDRPKDLQFTVPGFLIIYLTIRQAPQLKNTDSL